MLLAVYVLDYGNTMLTAVFLEVKRCHKTFAPGSTKDALAGNVPSVFPQLAKLQCDLTHPLRVGQSLAVKTVKRVKANLLIIVIVSGDGLVDLFVPSST